MWYVSHTNIHACLINKEVFPHDEVFRARECMRVACPHANWPQMACSLWMIHQWADFWFLLLHYQFSPLLLAEFLNLVSSLGLFYSLYKNVSWARWPIPTKEVCTRQSSSQPLPGETAPADASCCLGPNRPGDTPWATRRGARESSWTLNVGGLFSIVGNGTHPHQSETTHRAQRVDLWVGAGWVEGKCGLVAFPWRFY